MIDTQKELAKIAIEIDDLFRARAKEKQKETQLIGKDKDGNYIKASVPQISIKPTIDTQKELAKIADVSGDTIKD